VNVDPAVLGLGGASVLQLVAVAFWAGILTARVKNLEKQMEPMIILANNVGVLGSQMTDMRREMEDLNKALAWMRSPEHLTALRSPAA
jgi:hypothetical protein